jgi:PKD repeat protein
MQEQAGLKRDSAVGGWVWDTNVHALVDSLGAVIGYRPDQWDWDAIDSGLQATNSEDPGRWYTYPLVGTATLTLELANDPGSSVVTVRVHHPGEPLLEARVETVISMLAQYRVVREHS